jgi:PilZ domain
MGKLKPMISAKIAPDVDTDPRRREPRLELRAEVPIRVLGATPVDAQLVNISSNGFMAETNADLEAGMRIWLTLPGMKRVNALIIWTNNGRFGGQFAEPIDPLKVFHALGKSAPRG